MLIKKTLTTVALLASLLGASAAFAHALNVHIHHLRRKLGNGIVETVRGLGYRLGTADGGVADDGEHTS